MPLTSPYTSRSNRISATSGTPGSFWGKRSGIQRPISDTRVALHECFLTVGQRTLVVKDDGQIISGKWVLKPHKARYVLRGFEADVKEEDVFARR